MDIRAVTREYRIHEWGKRVKECRSSGKTVRGWCAEQGINIKSFYYWQRQLREAACQALTERQNENTSGLPVFAALQLRRAEIEEAAAVVIRMGEATVEVRSGAEQSTIESALRAVRAVC